MLDPWIIEEIRRREQEEQRQDHRIPVRIDLPIHQPGPDQVKPPEDETPRGIVVIDF